MRTPIWTYATWTVTALRTCTWAAQWRRVALPYRGPPSARAAATTACCPGSKVTSVTAASRTARAISASWSSSASGSWRLRWLSGDNKPTRVWKIWSPNRNRHRRRTEPWAPGNCAGVQRLSSAHNRLQVNKFIPSTLKQIVIYIGLLETVQRA